MHYPPFLAATQESVHGDLRFTCGGLLADMDGDEAGDAWAVLVASPREPGLDRIPSSRFAASFSCRLCRQPQQWYGLAGTAVLTPLWTLYL